MCVDLRFQGSQEEELVRVCDPVGSHDTSEVANTCPGLWACAVLNELPQWFPRQTFYCFCVRLPIFYSVELSLGDGIALTFG